MATTHIDPNAIFNTKGAAGKLSCSENWIHKLVYASRLKAYIYDEQGQLIERDPLAIRQGQGLYFYGRDLTSFEKNRRGRPAGSKDKNPRSAKSPEIA